MSREDALRALDELQEAAEASGAALLTDAEIGRIIAASREARISPLVLCPFCREPLVVDDDAKDLVCLCSFEGTASVEVCKLNGEEGFWVAEGARDPLAEVRLRGQGSPQSRGRRARARDLAGARAGARRRSPRRRSRARRCPPARSSAAISTDAPSS